jgi:hypothetical protein
MYTTIETKQIEISQEVFDTIPLEDGQTVFHGTYFATKPDDYINLYPTTFLENKDTGARLQMLASFKMPISPVNHDFYYIGESLKFTLLFPKIPKHWKQFDFIEIAAKGIPFVVKNITRNDSGIYKLELT